ncbi:hypothetical protein [Mycobacterium sp. 852002-51057_SCH5723018]|uniref:hypothetical protein n=1 Tax=Mycobacterium sp. 852002-51057_SCH5723018 TaxID=1834094 RepID=UPI000800A575|nr:hypothetical protein [Mycobacterium sp. 852002-51057_SCH5723018]OBG20574.1 hypothetical protein A5764_01455 [Mycobacterium sp. 852002-51057_SCH5723018]
MSKRGDKGRGKRRKGDDQFRAKAKATHLWDNMTAGLQQIAEVRKEAEEAGLEMPDDVRQQLVGIRQLLHDNGLPWEEIDATPGLHLPSGG